MPLLAISAFKKDAWMSYFIGVISRQCRRGSTYYQNESTQYKRNAIKTRSISVCNTWRDAQHGEVTQNFVIAAPDSHGWAYSVVDYIVDDSQPVCSKYADSSIKSIMERITPDVRWLQIAHIQES